MATVSFWQRQHHLEDVACDVAIVGGGIIGASTAFWLSRLEPRTRITVLDAGTLASGASGRNAGFVLQGAASDYLTDQARYGAAQARRLWQFTKESRDLIAQHADTDAVALETTGSMVVAGSAEEDARLQNSVQALRADGVPVSYLPPRELARRLRSQGYLGGLYVTGGGALNPASLVRHLVGQSGATVLDHHEVVGLSPSGSRIVVETSLRRVFAQRVVLALGAYLPTLVPVLEAYVRPVRAQMLATEPLIPRWLALPVYSHEGYFYLRQLANGIVLVGGARHLHERAEVGYDDVTTPALQRDLETYLHTHFPQTAALGVKRRWSGTMGFSPDGLPVLGTVPGLDNAHFATGFTGHGMAYGMRFGKMLAEHVSGDPTPPFLDLFHADRFHAF